MEFVTPIEMSEESSILPKMVSLSRFVGQEKSTIKSGKTHLIRSNRGNRTGGSLKQIKTGSDLRGL